MSHKTAPSKQRVLVVDDHGISRRFTVAALRQNNCAVKAAAGVSESIDKACAWLPEVIFTDWRLADGLGKDVVKGRAQQVAEPPRPSPLCTGHRGNPLRTRACNCV